MTGRTPNDEPFELVSIEKATAPSGSEGSDWFSYRIAQGSNTITGYRQGSLGAIKESLKEIVAGLNERRSLKRGRVQLTQNRKRKAAATGAT
ncbi:MAG TPA: hypothetical protein VFV10_09920 [Gammaproteobacteria bacterium]|nr:hypothetical protein [Gammaproteobacteria bacterium]